MLPLLVPWGRSEGGAESGDLHDHQQMVSRTSGLVEWVDRQEKSGRLISLPMLLID